MPPRSPFPRSAWPEPERSAGATIALVVLAAMLAPALAREKITRFVSDVDVQRNSDLHNLPDKTAGEARAGRSGFRACGFAAALVGWLPLDGGDEMLQLVRRRG